MPSPFPGMDPYLENPVRWGGVRLRLIVEVSDQLNRVLPNGFTAEIDQYVRIEEEAGEDRSFTRRNPDVFISAPLEFPKHQNGAATALMEAPTVETILLPGPVVKHRRLLIQSYDGKKILTAIEILSPSNKSGGTDRDAYLAKRSEYLAAGINLVEIDLLRAGNRLPFGRPHPPATDYYILVSAAEKRPKTSIWAFSVRQALPVFPVPLSADLDSVALDLHACLERIYVNGRYGDKLDYSKPATPPLNQPDAEWAASLFAKPTKKKKK